MSVKQGLNVDWFDSVDVLSDEYKRPWTFSASSGAFLWDDPIRITDLRSLGSCKINNWIFSQSGFAGLFDASWSVSDFGSLILIQVNPMERTLANLWILCFDVILHSAMRLENRRMLFFHLRILSCKNKSMFWSIRLSADEINNKHFRLNPYFKVIRKWLYITRHNFTSDLMNKLGRVRLTVFRNTN